MKPEIVSIYIDGFNFYHRAIKGRDSKYYYPSLKALCEIMLDSLQLEYMIKEIHYFTAKVKKTDADPKKQLRQKYYNKALQKEGVTIHYGKFVVRNSGRREKETDVNIAVRMLNDAWSNSYDHGVLLSNDTDYVELLRTVRDDRNKKVGVWNTGSKQQKLADHATYAAIIKPEYIRQAPQIANKGFQRSGGI